MDPAPSPETKDTVASAPEPEVLKTRSDSDTTAGASPPPPTAPPSQAIPKKPDRRSYRPSHRATFIGVAVVALILAVNAGILYVVLKKQAKNDNLLNNGQVTLSNGDLNRLGINRSVIGDSGVQLLVAPDAQFKGKLDVGGNTTISGQLILNSKLTGTDANLTQLQAGNTSLSKLSVNGDTSLSSLVLRKDLTVNGTTRLQGPITLSQLLTVNNNVNIAGNLSIGGILTVNTFNVHSIVVSGHLLTNGSTPGVGRGSAVGSNGSVSISGNDTAGTVAINIGAGASGGILASVAFRTQYGNIPRVVISPVGIGGNFYVTSLSGGGFSIGINSGLPPGGYRINYIVVQ